MGDHRRSKEGRPIAPTAAGISIILVLMGLIVLSFFMLSSCVTKMGS